MNDEGTEYRFFLKFCTGSRELTVASADVGTCFIRMGGLFGIMFCQIVRRFVMIVRF